MSDSPTSTAPRHPMPRVTVCVPTIGRPEFLREALASVAAQTYRDISVVVADNSGTPDAQRSTDQILAEFRVLDIELIRHPSRMEPTANFNCLVDAAKSEYWVCLPDDDRLCPSFIERTVEVLDRHPQCGLAFTDHWIIRSDGSIDEGHSIANSATYGRSRLVEGVYSGNRVFQVALRQAMCLQAAMFRSQVIKASRFIPGILALDYSLFLRLGAEGSSVDAYYIDARLMEYRIHDSQTSSTTGQRKFLEAEIAALESVSAVPRDHRAEYQTKLSSCYLSLSLLEAEAGEQKIARRHAIQSLGLHPTVRNIIGAGLATLLPAAIPITRSLRSSIKAATGWRRSREVSERPRTGQNKGIL